MRKTLLYIAQQVCSSPVALILEQNSISSIDKDNFYQSKQDIETAINGIYQEFTVDGFYGMFNNQSIYINDLQTDYVKAGAQTNSAHAYP